MSSCGAVAQCHASGGGASSSGASPGRSTHSAGDERTPDVDLVVARHGHTRRVLADVERLSAQTRWRILRRAKRRVTRRGSQVFLIAALVLLCALHILDVPLPAFVSAHNREITVMEQGRRLADPPPNLSLETRRSGGVILHCIALLYMFMAIAIVCDECFVPALEVISEVLELSPDVAGATFMAAGGSAPEFFTSLIGAMVVESDIGTGTIIGSAVFNVLFVIGACALVSPWPLQLTWFPLARDSAFYVVDLLVVSITFLDEKIMWYEAVILFILYIAYTTFMVFSERIESRFKGDEKKEEDTETDEECDKAHAEGTTEDAEHGCWAKSRGEAQDCTRIHPQVTPSKDQESHSPSPPAAAGTGEESGSNWGSGLSKGHVGDKPLTRAATNTECNKRHSNPEKLFRHKSMRVASQSHTHHGTVTTMKGGEQHQGSIDDSTGGSKEDAEEHAEEPQAPAPMAGPAPAPAPTGAAPRLVSDLELTDVVPSQDVPGSTTAGGQSSKGTANGAGGAGTANGEAEDGDEDDEEENEPLSIYPPEDANLKDMIWYVTTIPIVVCLVLTIPDVRREGFRRFYVVTFIMSILWIAGFTWVMVWMATVIAETCGLDEHIMGLTVLAAGTSVPDLLTSMIVAREGHGDMAISSSIGSNIFDVTVGLPVPWMLYAAIRDGKPITIKNESLEISVLLLLAMLSFTIGTIVWHNWEMTKWMGSSLLFLYVLFEVVSVGLTFAPEGSLKIIHV